MKKTYIVFGVLVVLFLIMLVLIKTYKKSNENYRIITNATHDEIVVVKENFEDDIISAIATDEGKIIETPYGTSYFLKLEIKDDKISDVKKILDDRVKEDGEKEVLGHFCSEYVEEINNGNVLAHYMIMSGGKHGETLIEEMWIVEIGEKTYLYYDK